MPPHLRHGLLFLGACVAVGGVLAASVRFAAPPPGASIKSVIGEAKPSPVADDIAIDPLPTPTADKDDPAKPEPSATPTPTATPAPRYRANSVFGARKRGSLACRIPGADAFVVEWNSADGSAVAHFAGVNISGSMTQQRSAATNVVDSAIAISREDGGHRLSLTISDAGAMRASVDGNDSAGSCSPS